MKRSELEARANVLGVRPETLRMRIYRESLRKRAKSYQEPPFETFGLKLSAKFKDDLKAVRSRLDRAASRIGLARIEVERALRSRLPCPVAQLETLVDVLLSAEERVAQAMPRSLCPYCKGIDQIQADCRACKGAGLASVQQWASAPRRLKDEPLVVYEGREVPLSDFASEPRPSPFGE